MASDTAATLLQALQALYHHPEPEVRTAASKWLEDFQQTQEAWQIADQLLHEQTSSLEAQYFCAQTLRTKVQRDFEELPTNAADSLRDSLLALLIKFQQGPPAVRTQLCLAIADLAAHAPSWQWGDGHGVIRWLGNQFGAQQDAVSGLLELLTVLPQEAESYKLALRPERRRQYLGELVTSVPDVLVLLEACLTAGSSSGLRPQILQAFAAWIRYGTGMPASALTSNSLVLASLDGLKSPETFDAAVDAVCELIRYTVSGGSSSLVTNMVLVQFIVNRVMVLRPRFSAALAKNSVIAQPQPGADEELEQDEDTLKGLARVFAEMGEAFVHIIASGSDEAMQIVQIIAEVTSHKEYEIASITFNFWHDLSTILTEGTRDEDGVLSEENAVTVVEKERRLTVFKPAFGLLASLVSFRVQYPPEYEAWRKDERADFKQTRYAIADILTDAASVYGGEALLQLLAQPFFKEAESAATGGEWDVRKVEACLYCMRGIANKVPRSEHDVLPKVMEILPRLPSHPLLLYTASLTIAAYADWLTRASSAAAFLPPLLTLLTSALSAAEDAPPAAALAFKHVCDACRDHLVASVDPLLRIYEQVMAGDGSLHLDREDELEIVEGLCLVVSALPPDRSLQAVQTLCVPIASKLEAVVVTSQQVGSLNQPSSSDYILHIDRLANIFRYIQQAQPLAAAFQGMWPLLKTIYAQRAADGRVMERLGRACKYAIRSCREHLVPSLGPLLEEVQRLYQEQKQPCCLYVASEIIKVFGRDPSCGPPLATLIGIMFGQTVQLLKSLKDFTEQPDIADDCFLMASRCIRYCPDLLVPAPAFSQLLDCALAGIFVQHREACKSILSFLKDSIELPLSKQGGGFRPMVEAAVVPRGPALVRLLLAGLTGALPESRIDEIVDVMRVLTELCGPAVSQWASVVLEPIPITAISETEKLSLVGGLGAGGLGTDGRTLSARMEEISDAARRSKRVMELVQSALRT